MNFCNSQSGKYKSSNTRAYMLRVGPFCSKFCWEEMLHKGRRRKKNYADDPDDFQMNCVFPLFLATSPLSPKLSAFSFSFSFLTTNFTEIFCDKTLHLLGFVGG